MVGSSTNPAPATTFIASLFDLESGITLPTATENLALAVLEFREPDIGKQRDRISWTVHLAEHPFPMWANADEHKSVFRSFATKPVEKAPECRALPADRGLIKFGDEVPIFLGNPIRGNG